MTIRKNVWLCREVHCEGEPMPETAFTLRTARSIDAQEAAEHFSQHLDEKEHGDLSDWDMTQVEMWKTIEVEESPGAWRRFRVNLAVRLDYQATTQPLKDQP